MQQKFLKAHKMFDITIVLGSLLGSFNSSVGSISWPKATAGQDALPTTLGHSEIGQKNGKLNSPSGS